MKGLILAAGKGSRLYPITHLIPKPLLPLANRVTMEYAFDRMKEMGITEIGIVVGENEAAMREGLHGKADGCDRPPKLDGCGGEATGIATITRRR